MTGRVDDSQSMLSRMPSLCRSEIRNLTGSVGSVCAPDGTSSPASRTTLTTGFCSLTSVDFETFVRALVCAVRVRELSPRGADFLASCESGLGVDGPVLTREAGFFDGEGNRLVEDVVIA